MKRFKRGCLSDPSSGQRSSQSESAPPRDEIKICVIYMSGRRYEVLANQYITPVRGGTYHFDGTPLKENDPRIISIDYVPQGKHKTQALTVSATFFETKNSQENNTKKQESVVDSGSCCSIQ